MYYITTVSAESLEAGTNLFYSVMFYTPSSAGQPKVDIKDIALYDNFWYAQTEMDENTFGFLAIGANESYYYFDYSPALLAFTIWTLVLHSPNAFPLYNSSGYAPLCPFDASGTKVRATTWGLATNGRFSSIITTKQRTYSATSTPNEVKPMDAESEPLKECITKEETERLQRELRGKIMYFR